VTERSSLAVLAAAVGVELRRWWRQPIAVAATLVAPVAVASLVSLALGGQQSLDATVAVADLDGGPVAEAFMSEGLGHPRVADVVDVREVESARMAERLVDDGSVAAAVVLPAGMSEGLAAGSPGPRVLRPGEPSLGTDLVDLVVDSFATRVRATGVALEATGELPPDVAALTVAPVAPGGRALDAATHYGPAVGLFFVMVVLGYAVDNHVADRRRGLVDRVAATSAPAWAVAAGRALAALSVGCMSLAVTSATMQLAFGRSWGPMLSVAGLAVAVSFAIAGLTAAVSGVARTPGQAQGLTVALAFGMALASGSFTPPGATTGRPPLADLLPVTMALDGFTLAATEDAGLAALASVLAGLAAVGVVGFLATAALTSFPVRRPR
jgi:hypothetical protein